MPSRWFRLADSGNLRQLRHEIDMDYGDGGAGAKVYRAIMATVPYRRRFREEWEARDFVACNATRMGAGFVRVTPWALAEVMAV